MVSVSVFVVLLLVVIVEAVGMIVGERKSLHGRKRRFWLGEVWLGEVRLGYNKSLWWI